MYEHTTSSLDEMTAEVITHMIVKRLTVRDNPSDVQLSRHFVKLPERTLSASGESAVDNDVKD